MRVFAVPATMKAFLSPALPDNFFARWLLIFVLAAGVYFFSGFLVPVLAALIIGFASWPLYKRLLDACGGSSALAATIALLAIVAGLVVPIALALTFAAQEVHEWVDWLIRVNRQGGPAPGWIRDLPVAGSWLAAYWDQHLAAPHAINRLLQEISGKNLGGIYKWLLTLSSMVVEILLTLLFMLITLFFIFKDGDRLVQQLDLVGERILPAHWQRFSRVVPATVSSTVMGMGVIAIGEGVVLGVAYAIAGVPSATALGVVTGFMALIPGGAPLAFTLVSLYLVGSGDPIAGIALMTWGSVELFIVDKTLRPRLVGGPIKLPFLPTFFGLVGGVATMGFVGLFVGPVLMALLVAIWREWVHSIEVLPRPGAGTAVPAPPEARD
jgi:predicted PurR-regulated permease PerM